MSIESVRCAFCKGLGKDPFGIMSELSTCCVCGGGGSVLVTTPYIGCAHCNGTGAVKTLTCTACGGKGVLSAVREPSIPCPECRGSGNDSSSSGMACLHCRGSGRVPLETPTPTMAPTQDQDEFKSRVALKYEQNPPKKDISGKSVMLLPVSKPVAINKIQP